MNCVNGGLPVSTLFKGLSFLRDSAKYCLLWCIEYLYPLLLLDFCILILFVTHASSLAFDIPVLFYYCCVSCGFYAWSSLHKSVCPCLTWICDWKSTVEYICYSCSLDFGPELFISHVFASEVLPTTQFTLLQSLQNTLPTMDSRSELITSSADTAACCAKTDS